MEGSWETVTSKKAWDRCPVSLSLSATVIDPFIFVVGEHGDILEEHCASGELPPQPLHERLPLPIGPNTALRGAGKRNKMNMAGLDECLGKVQQQDQ